MTQSEPQDIPDPKNQSRSRVRASDAERERIADRLRAAVTDGRLSLEEGDERLAALYAMKFRDELPSLTRDLPGDPGDEPERGPWGGWSTGWSPWGDRRSGPEDETNIRAGGGGWGSPGGSSGPGGWSGGPGGWGRPGWGGPGGPGWGMRRTPWPFRVFPVLMLLILIGAIVSAVGGHFFWPIIPLFFLFTALGRIAFFNACRRGWRR